MNRLFVARLKNLFPHVRRMMAVVLCTVVMQPVMAQESTGTFSLIPKIGLSLANISGYNLYYSKDANFLSESVAKGKFNSRFMGGVEAEYQAFPNVSFSLGVLYSRQGCRLSDFEIVVDSKTRDLWEDIRHSLDYINVPFTVNGYIAEGLAVKAGLQLGFLVSSKFSYSSTSINKKGDVWEYGDEFEMDNDDKKMRNTLDVSIPIGVSYEYLNVVIDARYHFGLTKLYKDDNMPKERNQLISLSVGYKFNL